MKPRTTNSSLTNALRILKNFHLEQTDMTLQEIAETQDISISTAYRLLKTMEEERFILYDKQQQHYQIGTSVLRLTNTMLDELTLLKEMTPYLSALSEKTGLTSHLAILQDEDVLYLKMEYGLLHTQLKSHIGRRNPYYATSTGQAIVAFYTEEKRAQLLEKTVFEALTKNTLTTPQQYEKKFAHIRQIGYAVSIEELHLGVMSIAAPLFNHTREVVAAVSVAGNVKTVQPNVEKICRAVQQTADAITARIHQSHARSHYDIFNQ